MPQEYAITCTHLLPVHCAPPGQSSAIDQWTLATIAPCPACGGHLLYAENGNVPGYRICQTCGRAWTVRGSHDAEANTVTVRFAIPDTDRGPEWEYGKPDVSDEAYEYYVSRMQRHGGSPRSRYTWTHYQGGK